MEGILAAERVDAQPYHWPHDAPMDSNTTALVIIDMQKDCKYTDFQCYAVFFLHERRVFRRQYFSRLQKFAGHDQHPRTREVGPSHYRRP